MKVMKILTLRTNFFPIMKYADGVQHRQQVAAGAAKSGRHGPSSLGMLT